MKELLAAIETALKAAAGLSYITDATGIWITPDEDILPMTATFPGIGIKDGPITRIVHTNIKWEVHMRAGIIIYVKLSAGDTALMGQTLPLIHGDFDIADAIHTALNENYLGITGMEQAFCTGEQESQITGDQDFVLLKKRLDYEYIKEETRP